MGEDYALLYNGPFKDIGDYFSIIMAALEKQMSTWMVRMGNPLTIIWLSFDKSIYNIAVSFVSMIFFFLIFFYGNARKPNVNNLGDLIGFFVPASLMMFLSPSIGDLFFGAMAVLIIYGLFVYYFCVQFLIDFIYQRRT
ncbi:hypothetical protein ACK2FV_05615 [Clostridioides difficile]